MWVKHLDGLSDAERTEIELEENPRRKDLTEYERARAFVGLASVAGEILRQSEFRPSLPKIRRSGLGVDRRSLMPTTELLSESSSRAERSAQHIGTSKPLRTSSRPRAQLTPVPHLRSPLAPGAYS
jgi:hypothetical protein